MATAKTRKYKKVSCHQTKTAATAAAKVLRGKGMTASVRKVKGGACVFSAGKAKVSGTSKRKRTTRRK